MDDDYEDRIDEIKKSRESNIIKAHIFNNFTFIRQENIEKVKILSVRFVSPNKFTNFTC